MRITSSQRCLAPIVNTKSGSLLESSRNFVNIVREIISLRNSRAGARTSSIVLCGEKQLRDHGDAVGFFVFLVDLFFVFLDEGIVQVVIQEARGLENVKELLGFIENGEKHNALEYLGPFVVNVILQVGAGGGITQEFQVLEDRFEIDIPAGYVRAGGFTFAFSLPIVVAGSVMKTLFKKKLQQSNRLSVDIGINSLSLNCDF